MYFIDFGYYELYGELLTNETYIKSKRGIKPKHFNDVSQDLISKKHLFLKKEAYYSRTIHRYYPTIIPTHRFSQKELNVINKIIKNLSNNNASSITKYVIHDPPIIIANFVILLALLLLRFFIIWFITFSSFWLNLCVGIIVG